jgi:hypothetical protein
MQKMYYTFQYSGTTVKISAYSVGNFCFTLTDLFIVTSAMLDDYKGHRIQF